MTPKAIFNDSSDTPIISAHQLTRTYTMGETQVTGVKNIDLIIPSGAFVVLKGNSGSGKSTLLSLLGGLDRPTYGELSVGDVDLTLASPTDLDRFRREKVGMVFQSFNLLPTLNVLENICLPALLAGEAWKKAHSRGFELVQWLGLEERQNHFPDQLSGGEMQRTAIARALINDPDLILADEPTGNLDSKNGKLVVKLLSMLHLKLKRSIIVATHSRIFDAVATNQIFLKDGEVFIS